MYIYIYVHFSRRFFSCKCLSQSPLVTRHRPFECLQDSQLAPLPLGPGPFRGTVALSRAAEGDGAMHAAITFPKERSVAIFAHTGAMMRCLVGWIGNLGQD